MLRKILPHAAIIISGMYFVFFFIDRVNSAMAFIDNDITKILLFILCVVSVVNAILLLKAERRRIIREQKRSKRRNEQKRPVSAPAADRKLR